MQGQPAHTLAPQCQGGCGKPCSETRLPPSPRHHHFPRTRFCARGDRGRRNAQLWPCENLTPDPQDDQPPGTTSLHPQPFSQPETYRCLQSSFRGRRLGWAGGSVGLVGAVGGILPLLHGPGNGRQRGELLPLRQARCGVQALLALQASLILRGCMPERGLEAPQENVRASTGRLGERAYGT